METNFLVASMSTFVRNPLLKSASELEKMKKNRFFQFSQNDPRLDIWSLGGFLRLCDISNPIPCHSWPFWSNSNYFFKIEFSTLKMLFLLIWALRSSKSFKYEVISKSNLFFNFCRMDKPSEFWMRQDH